MAAAISQDIYRKIIQAAENIASITCQAPTSTFIPPTSTFVDSDLQLGLRLPQPTPIFTSLTVEGISADAARKLSGLFVKNASELRTRLDANFRDTWTKLSQLPRHDSMSTANEFLEQLLATFRAVYEQRLSSWASEIRQLAISKSKLTSNPPQAVPASFNHSYIPILEAFFAEEQFPHRADKAILAQKSGMTYRQIHVWFQNRRSRSHRAPSNIDDHSHLTHNDCESSEDTDVEDVSVKSCFSSRASSFTLVADNHPFDSNSPPHAFPGKYPPDFDEQSDPFPCRFGDFSSFLKTTWDRKPASSPTVQTSAEVNTDHLVEAFSNLRIRPTPNSEQAEVKRPRIWGSYNLRPFYGCDVMAAYTTRPFSAPIPSFIRYPHQEKDSRPCAIFRPQCRNLLQVKPDTPSNCTYATKKKRSNKSRLPKRVPTNQPKLSAMSNSISDPLGFASSDAANSRAWGRSLTPSLERVATVTRSASSSSDESLPSLTPSVSPSSSSEAQSPSSPAQGLSNESALCFLPELSTISIPDASQGLVADIPFSLFAPSDFNYDLLSSKPFVDNAYDLAFSQSQMDPFLSLQLQPPPAIPQSLPFSFEFAPLTS